MFNSCVGFTRRRTRLVSREFLYIDILKQKSLKEERKLEVKNEFAEQGRRGCSGSLTIGDVLGD